MNALSDIRVPAAPHWVLVSDASPMGRPVEIDGPFVSRQLSSPQSAKLVVPRNLADGRAAHIYDDGSGRIGFRFQDFGKYKVALYGKRLRTVTIPRRYVDAMPVGRTACKVYEEAGLLVLDMNQFRKEV